MVGHLFLAWGLAPLVLLLSTIAAGVSADDNHDGQWSTSISSAAGPSAQQEQHEGDDEDATSTKRRRLKLITYNDDDKVIQGDYIVFFRTDLKADEEIERIQQRAKSLSSSSDDAYSFAVEHTYSIVLNGAALSNVSDAMLAALLADESVESVEPDRPTRLATITTASSDSSAVTADTASTASSAVAVKEVVFSSPPQRPRRQELHPRWLVDDNPVTTQDLPGGDPWGLDRLDSPAKDGLDGRYRYRLTGAGVDVFVFDTGLRFDHSEFGGGNNGESRARCGLNLIWDEDCADNHGHGTHVAGIIGGTTFGVAKEAQLWSVKTLDRNGGGKASIVIAGLDFVLLQLQLDGADRPAVVNLSLDSGFSNALNAAVDNAVDRGVVVVMAAGNSAADACTRSPSSAARGISVGAVDKDSKKYRDSNVGPCIDIFAPGKAILSSSLTGGSEKMEGTSQAAPHVAGVAALYLDYDKTLSPQNIYDYVVINHAALNQLTGLGEGSPNRLVQTTGLNDMVEEDEEHDAWPDRGGFCGFFFFSTCTVKADCCFPACRSLGVFGTRCWFW